MAPALVVAHLCGIDVGRPDGTPEGSLYFGTRFQLVLLAGAILPRVVESHHRSVMLLCVQQARMTNRSVLTARRSGLSSRVGFAAASVHVASPIASVARTRSEEHTSET